MNQTLPGTVLDDIEKDLYRTYPGIKKYKKEL